MYPSFYNEEWGEHTQFAQQHCIQILDTRAGSAALSSFLWQGFVRIAKPLKSMSFIHTPS